MNTQKGGKGSPRPRRDESMLDRALNYAKLNSDGMNVTDIVDKFKENSVTVYKLIRLGNAPKSVISLIKKKVIPATIVANLLKSSMSDREMIEVVNEEVQKRNDALKQLEKEGFRGASSMTAKRAIKIAMNNLKKRRLVKGEGQKAIVRFLSEFLGTEKPSVADIERAILMN